jgi:hypothetical protein
MNLIKKIIIILLLFFIFSKIFKKKKKENFQKLGYKRLDDGSCKNYEDYELDQFLTDSVGCYMKCNERVNCNEYYFRSDGKKNFYNDSHVNCYLVDKNKGKCEIEKDSVYEHYIKNFNDINEKLYIDNYFLINPEYKNHKYSSVLYNDQIGTGYARGRLGSNSAISFDKKKAVLTDKGYMHWFQFDLNNNLNVGGVLIEGSNEFHYPKKISVKLSDTGNDWDSRDWELIFNHLPLYTSNNITISKKVDNILTQDEIYIVCNITTPSTFSDENNIFLIGSDDSCGGLSGFLKNGKICLGNKCNKMIVTQKNEITPTPNIETFALPGVNVTTYQNTPTPTPSPIDCDGSWSVWSKCIDNKQSRTYTVTTQSEHGGTECPSSPESQKCIPSVFDLLVDFFQDGLNKKNVDWYGESSIGIIEAEYLAEKTLNYFLYNNIQPNMKDIEKYEKFYVQLGILYSSDVINNIGLITGVRYFSKLNKKTILDFMTKNLPLTLYEKPFGILKSNYDIENNSDYIILDKMYLPYLRIDQIIFIGNDIRKIKDIIEVPLITPDVQSASINGNKIALILNKPFENSYPKNTTLKFFKNTHPVRNYQKAREQFCNETKNFSNYKYYGYDNENKKFRASCKGGITVPDSSFKLDDFYDWLLLNNKEVNENYENFSPSVLDLLKSFFMDGINKSYIGWDSSKIRIEEVEAEYISEKTLDYFLKNNIQPNIEDIHEYARFYNKLLNSSNEWELDKNNMLLDGMTMDITFIEDMIISLNKEDWQNDMAVITDIVTKNKIIKQLTAFTKYQKARKKFCDDSVNLSNYKHDGYHNNASCQVNEGYAGNTNNTGVSGLLSTTNGTNGPFKLDDYYFWLFVNHPNLIKNYKNFDLGADKVVLYLLKEFFIYGISAYNLLWIGKEFISEIEAEYLADKTFDYFIKNNIQPDYKNIEEYEKFYKKIGAFTGWKTTSPNQIIATNNFKTFVTNYMLGDLASVDEDNKLTYYQKARKLFCDNSSVLSEYKYYGYDNNASCKGNIINPENNFDLKEGFQENYENDENDDFDLGDDDYNDWLRENHPSLAPTIVVTPTPKPKYDIRIKFTSETTNNLSDYLVTTEDFKKIKEGDKIHIYEKDTEIANFILDAKIENNSQTMEEGIITSKSTEIIFNSSDYSTSGRNEFVWYDIWDPIQNKYKNGLKIIKFIDDDNDDKIHKFGNIILNGKRSNIINNIKNNTPIELSPEEISLNSYLLKKPYEIKSTPNPSTITNNFYLTINKKVKNGFTSLTTVDSFKELRNDDEIIIFEDSNFITSQFIDPNIIASFQIKDIIYEYDYSEEIIDDIDGISKKIIKEKNRFIIKSVFPSEIEDLIFDDHIWDSNQNKYITSIILKKNIVDNNHQFGNIVLNGNQSLQISELKDDEIIYLSNFFPDTNMVTVHKCIDKDGENLYDNAYNDDSERSCYQRCMNSSKCSQFYYSFYPPQDPQNPTDNCFLLDKNDKLCDLEFSIFDNYHIKKDYYEKYNNFDNFNIRIKRNQSGAAGHPIFDIDLNSKFDFQFVKVNERISIFENDIKICDFIVNDIKIDTGTRVNIGKYKNIKFFSDKESNVPEFIWYETFPNYNNSHVIPSYKSGIKLNKKIIYKDGKKIHKFGNSELTGDQSEEIDDIENNDFIFISDESMFSDNFTYFNYNNIGFKFRNQYSYEKSKFLTKIEDFSNINYGDTLYIYENDIEIANYKVNPVSSSRQEQIAEDTETMTFNYNVLSASQGIDLFDDIEIHDDIKISNMIWDPLKKKYFKGVILKYKNVKNENGKLINRFGNIDLNGKESEKIKNIISNKRLIINEEFLNEIIPPTPTPTPKITPTPTPFVPRPTPVPTDISYDYDIKIKFTDHNTDKLSDYLVNTEDFKKIKNNDKVHIYENNIEIANFVIQTITPNNSEIIIKSAESISSGINDIIWKDNIWDTYKNKYISGLVLKKYIVDNIHKFGNIQLNDNQSSIINNIMHEQTIIIPSIYNEDPFFILNSSYDIENNSDTININKSDSFDIKKGQIILIGDDSREIIDIIDEPLIETLNQETTSPTQVTLVLNRPLESSYPKNTTLKFFDKKNEYSKEKLSIPEIFLKKFFKTLGFYEDEAIFIAKKYYFSNILGNNPLSEDNINEILEYGIEKKVFPVEDKNNIKNNLSPTNLSGTNYVNARFEFCSNYNSTYDIFIEDKCKNLNSINREFKLVNLPTPTPTPIPTMKPTYTPSPTTSPPTPIPNKEPKVESFLKDSSILTEGNKLATSTEYKLEFYYNKKTKECKIWVNDVLDVHNVNMNYSIPVGNITIGSGNHNIDYKPFNGMVKDISIYNYLEKNGIKYDTEIGKGLMGQNKSTNVFLKNFRRAKFVRIYLGENENSYYNHPSLRAGVLVKYTYDDQKLENVSTKWSLILNPKTAEGENLAFTQEQKNLYDQHKIDDKLYKHINNMWYYDGKSLCIPYISNFNEENNCDWTIPEKGYWFKNPIDTSPNLKKAKNRLLEIKDAYAITYHPNIGTYGTYFIHGSSLKMRENNKDYNTVETFFYLPRSSKVGPIFYLNDVNSKPKPKYYIRIKFTSETTNNLSDYLVTTEDFKKIKEGDKIHIYEKDTEIANFILDSKIENNSTNMEDGIITSKSTEIIFNSSDYSTSGRNDMFWYDNIWNPIQNKYKTGLKIIKFIDNNIQKFGNIILNGKQSDKINNIMHEQTIETLDDFKSNNKLYEKFVDVSNTEVQQQQQQPSTNNIDTQIDETTPSNYDPNYITTQQQQQPSTASTNIDTQIYNNPPPAPPVTAPPPSALSSTTIRILNNLNSNSTLNDYKEDIIDYLNQDSFYTSVEKEPVISKKIYLGINEANCVLGQYQQQDINNYYYNLISGTCTESIWGAYQVVNREVLDNGLVKDKNETNFIHDAASLLLNKDYDISKLVINNIPNINTTDDKIKDILDGEWWFTANYSVQGYTGGQGGRGLWSIWKDGIKQVHQIAFRKTKELMLLIKDLPVGGYQTTTTTPTPTSTSTQVNDSNSKEYIKSLKDFFKTRGITDEEQSEFVAKRFYLSHLKNNKGLTEEDIDKIWNYGLSKNIFSDSNIIKGTNQIKQKYTKKYLSSSDYYIIRQNYCSSEFNSNYDELLDKCNTNRLMINVEFDLSEAIENLPTPTPSPYILPLVPASKTIENHLISEKDHLGYCSNKKNICDRDLYYCPGGKKYGNIKLQRDAVLEATIDIINNKIYNNCPSILNVLPTSNKIGVIISPSKLVIDENDDGILKIVLTSAPKGDVNLNVNLSDIGEISVEKNLITFNKDNWNLPQILKVNAINNYEIDKEKNLSIKFAFESIDDDYNMLQDTTIQILKINDDLADILINPEKLEINEGEEKIIELSLNSKPTAPVNISIEMNDIFRDQLILDNNLLIYNENNWNLKKEIKIRGQIDNIVDGDVDAILIISVNSQDPNYNNLKNKEINVKVIDNKIDPTMYFSHNCSSCSCDPDDPLVCSCKNCVQNYFDKLYPTYLDISNEKIKKLLTKFINKFYRLKNMGNIEELSHNLLNINRFYINMNSNYYLINNDIFIENNEIQMLINKFIENIYIIDYDKSSKIKLDDKKKEFFEEVVDILNIGDYFYRYNFEFKFKFENENENSDINCKLNIMYNENEKLWIIVNELNINPITLDYL